jgi:acyl carrier protein
MYRTGDLARHRGDGLIFAGRRDLQVKVRGIRIELGEIVSVLGSQPGVREAFVDVRRHGQSDRLVAYIVMEEGVLPPGADGLRRALQRTLPEHMLPGGWVFLDRLPLTVNGKVDRDALPEPVRVQASPAGASASAAERDIAAAWQVVLGGEMPGLEDNFFEVGGDSFTLVRLHEELEQRLRIKLELVDLFKYPTVASLAACLTERNASSGESQERRDRRSEQRKAALQQEQQRAKQRKAARNG